MFKTLNVNISNMKAFDSDRSALQLQIHILRSERVRLLLVTIISGSTWSSLYVNSWLVFPIKVVKKKDEKEVSLEKGEGKKWKNFHKEKEEMKVIVRSYMPR